MNTTRAMLALLLTASPAVGQPVADPFPEAIGAGAEAVEVNVVEFASIPEVDGGPARMMLLVDEPGTRRMFVNDMRGSLYSVSYDGATVTRYLDLDAPRWAVSVDSSGSERGFQSFAFHPQFNESGTPGFGKLYALTDTSNRAPSPDFRPSGADSNSHDTVLIEWTARSPGAVGYDGGAPRELMRFEQPFRNHNGGHLAFNPLASPGDAEFGLLYVGMADGGSGGDPLDLAQNLSSGFGKILRIDPLGAGSANGRYGIPAGNPFADDGDTNTLGEIYALGTRNPQRFSWDSANGQMFMADIGQNTVEEVSPVTAGANLGWNAWEGSFTYISRDGVDPANPRGDADMTFPVVEYDQQDRLLQRSAAATMGSIYRHDEIAQLTGLLLFGDNPSGEIFAIDADHLPEGGQDPIRRVLLVDDGVPKTLLQIVREKNVEQGAPSASRADLRFGLGPDGRVFLLNKGDGTIRLLVP